MNNTRYVSFQKITKVVEIAGTEDSIVVAGVHTFVSDSIEQADVGCVYAVEINLHTCKRTIIDIEDFYRENRLHPECHGIIDMIDTSIIKLLHHTQFIKD